MNNDELKYILKQSTDAAERQSACPGDYELASYMDGGLSECDHGRFELHLADCPYCIERVGILGRAGEGEPAIHTPELLQTHIGKLAGISRLENIRDQRSRWKKIPRWAAAAVVVLAFGVLSQMFSPVPNDLGPSTAVEIPGQSSGMLRETRNLNPVAMAPNFLSSHEGMEVMPGNGVFRWTPVPDSLYYQLRIVSDEGDLVWQGRVNSTQWILPLDLSLSRGAEYFVRVDAYFTEAKALSSDYLLFRVGDG